MNGLFNLIPPSQGELQDIANTATAPLAPQPFTWGAGGARLTPEALAMQQKQVEQERAAGLDFSPVQSWTQGAARVANAFLANRDQGRLAKGQAADASARAAIFQSLTGGGQAAPSVVASALADPDPVVQKIGAAAWERANPKPVNNDTVQDYNFRVQTLGKDAADEWLRRGNDPFITASLPGGRFYAGPQSGFAGAVGGGAAAPVAPTAQPPATLPPDFDFGDGGAAPATAPRPFP